MSDAQAQACFQVASNRRLVPTMNEDKPSPFTPEGQVEMARGFGMGWKRARRWKKIGLLLSPLIVLACVLVVAIVYALFGYVKGFFG